MDIEHMNNHSRAVIPLVACAMVVVGVTSLSLLLSIPVAADAIDSSERSPGGTEAEPGEEVEITITVVVGDDVPETGNFNLEDDFDPGFESVSMGATRYNGDTFFDSITVSDDEFIELAIDRADAPGGNFSEGDVIEQDFFVTIPDEASHDDEFTFEGQAQIGTEQTPTSGPDTITVVDPDASSDYMLSDLTPSAETVEQGDDPIDISVTVDNEGELDGQQDIDLTLVDDDTGEVAFEDTIAGVEVPAGESDVVNFEDVPVGDLAGGEYTHTVSSDDDDVSGSISVLAPDFQLSELTPDQTTVDQGDDPIDIAVTVENAGEADGTQDVHLEIVSDDTGGVDYEDTVEGVTLPVGEDEDITFEDVPVGDFDAGEYTHVVSSADDEVAGSISVEGPEYLLSNLDPEETSVDQGDDPIDVSVTVTNDADAEAGQSIDLSITDDATGAVEYQDTIDDVEISGGQSDSVRFDAVPVGEFDPGEYQLTIATDADDISGSISVIGPDFRLSDLDPTETTVAEGSEPIDVSVTVENVAGAAGSQDVELSIDVATAGGSVYDQTIEDVALAGGDDTDLTFENVPVGEFSRGEYDLTVSTENDEIGGSITIHGSEFQLTGLEPSSLTVENDTGPIDVSVEVENVGELDGQTYVSLDLVDDDVGFSVHDDVVEAVELSSGESHSVVFESVPVQDLSPGEYTLSVSSGDDEVTGSITVPGDPDLELPHYRLSGLNPDSITTSIDDGPIDVSVTIENDGAAEGTRDVIFEISAGDSAEPVYTDTVEGVALPVNDTTNIEFSEIPVGDFGAGVYTYTVATRDDSVSGTLTIEGAMFRLGDLRPVNTVEIEADAMESVWVIVENEGTTVDVQDIVAELVDKSTGEVVATDTRHDVAIAGGGSVELRFEGLSLADHPPGEYDISVSSAEDDITGQLTLLEPPSYQLISLEPDRITVDEREESFAISVDVENEAATDGEGDLEVRIVEDATGATVYERTVSVSIGGGERAQIHLAFPSAVLDPGEYTLTISSAVDDIFGEVTVTDGTDTDEQAADGGLVTDPSTDDDGGGFNFVVAAVALAVIGLTVRVIRL